MTLDIIYEDAEFVIVNKPSGILSIADRHNSSLPSIHKALRDRYDPIFIVHRIDRETSGCICFAKTEAAHKYLSMQFEKRTVDKTYLGIVHGTFSKPEGLIEDAIMEHPYIKGKMIVNQKQGKPSVTAYHTVESFGRYSLVSFTILTGRTHQIRLHCANLGHPIVCDALYGLTDPVFISSLKRQYALSKNEMEERPILQRLALHAHRLRFTAEGGGVVDVTAPLTKDMNAMLNQCRKWLT